MEQKKYGPSKAPAYTYCESVLATAASRWHIRPVNSRLFLTGGVDTPSFCNRVRPRPNLGGWDINVPITDRNIADACPICREAYQEVYNGDPKPGL
jgi:hypothetical protein